MVSCVGSDFYEVTNMTNEWKDMTLNKTSWNVSILENALKLSIVILVYERKISKYVQFHKECQRTHSEIISDGI